MSARAHPAEQTGVQRDREEHQVANGRTGNAELDEQRAVFAAARAVAIEAAIRMRWMADAIEVACDVRERRRRRIPRHVRAAAPEIDANLPHAWHAARRGLDEPHACSAAKVSEVQRGVLRAGRIAADVHALERSIIELRVAVRGRVRRRRLLAQRVEPLEPVRGDRTMHDLAAGAAELADAARHR